MKKLIFILLVLSMSAQARTKKKVISKSPTMTAVKDNSLKGQLSNALSLAQAGQYQPAAQALFNLVKRPELESERPQIKYILGKMLVEMKFPQVAAYQFVDVIRSENQRYLKRAIEELSLVADTLGDDTLLNYAVSKVDVNDFPEKNKDMIYFRIGEIKLKNKNFEDAVNAFNKVTFGSSYNNQALFNKGLAYLEMNKVDPAIAVFQQIVEHRAKSPVTDTNKVAAQMALARSYYQKQEWDSAIEAYSQIPRDHFMWHDALFEQSWAMLRGARFRSALSNFQSLHSAYYDDFYIPESLLLRSIVYLYICKYDEMEKVLTLFEKTYEPVKAKIGSFLNNNSDSLAYYAEIEKKLNSKRSEDIVGTMKLPYLVVKNISEEGDVRRSLTYLKKLQDEKLAVESSGSFRASGLGQYSVRVLNTRIKNTKTLIGDMAKVHLQNMKDELADLFEQSSFIRYEMINGKKETLRKKIGGRDLPATIDNQIDREFYIENGFEFYPFQGEYWLDEIGNYHFLGKQSCE